MTKKTLEELSEIMKETCKNNSYFKLTLEDCLKYPKAKVISADKGEWAGWISVIHLKSKSLTVILKGHFPEIEMRVNISDCKLILRDISQLTDEEKAQLLENHLNDQGRDILKRSSYSYGNFENRLYELDVKQTDYLRSISVDIDNFLKSGKAVKG